MAATPMAYLAMVMLCAQSAADRTPSQSSDSPSVELIQNSLKDYYQRIHSLSIEYEETWVPDITPGFSERFWRSAIRA